jgi:outer membrane protein OmpA-like peptidoglycan-associated protein
MKDTAMKRLLCTTTALSMALWPIPSVPAFAQSLAGDGSVVGPDGSVLCVPTAEAPCDPNNFVAEAQAIQDAMNAAAAQAEAEAAAAAQAAAEAEAAAAAQAQAEAEAAAAAQAAAEAEAAAAAQAEQEAAAAAQAEQDAAAAAAAQAEQDAASGAQTEADAAAAAQAQAEADAAAAAQAEADAAAQAQAEADAVAAQAQAEAEAAAAQAAAQAEADARAAEEAAAAAAAAEAAAAAQAAADASAEAQRLADEAAAAAAVDATDEAAATAAAEAQAAADAAAAEAAAATADAEAQAVAEADAAAAAQAAIDAQAALDAEAAVAAEAAAAEAEAAAAAAAAEGAVVEVVPETLVDPATLVDPEALPELQPEALTALDTLLSEPTATETAAEGIAEIAAPVAAAALIPLAPDAEPLADAPVPQVLEQLITEETRRSSAEEFAAAPAAVATGGRRSGLSDLEKVGLVVLGAIVVGAILSNGNEVVDNSGDRVVVRNPDGRYYVYKDDDTLLRQPGANVRTETYGDGSTRTIVDRADGTQVVTIRDATGRVLRRATYDRQGREIVLIDDLAPETRIDVSTLPRPSRERVTISTSDGDYELKTALARRQAADLGRSFSLRQIREIQEVRALAASVDVDSVTFDSGSAAITATQAEELADLGELLNQLITLNPNEIFLIEGHTDAVGSASSNLTLSDRRAESVALALTEYFDVPPENLVVQGYGESELLIPTTGDERANRRVAVKVITPLMQTAALE